MATNSNPADAIGGSLIGASRSRGVARRNGNASTCEACGAPLRPKRGSRRQKYCSYRCRDEARRGRNFANSGQTPKQSHDQFKISQQSQGPPKAISEVEGPLEIVGHGHRWPRTPQSDARRISNAIEAELGAYVLRHPPTDRRAP
jgi:hypothetical protein